MHRTTIQGLGETRTKPEMRHVGTIFNTWQLSVVDYSELQLMGSDYVRELVYCTVYNEGTSTWRLKKLSIITKRTALFK